MRGSLVRSATIAAAAFALGLVITMIAQREPMQSLTHEVVTTARSTWQRAGAANYDIRYELNGSDYDVQVRSNIVTEVTVNAVRPVSADWGNYSVSGLFDLLELEVENLTDSAGPFGGRGAAVIAKVRFDDKFGYPAHYLRSGGGPPPAIMRVESFAPVAD